VKKNRRKEYRKMKIATIDDLKKHPFMLLITVIVVIILLVGIFRSIAPFLSLGFGGYAHIGDVRGAISFETFENSNEPTFTMFYAPWCGHCKTTKPNFDTLKSQYKGKAKIVAVNGDEAKDTIKEHGVQGFPTLRYYPKGMGNAKQFDEYNGERTVEGMLQFLQKKETSF
jgi:thiol-disulfide isomerase/thioredoxin